MHRVRIGNARRLLFYRLSCVSGFVLHADLTVALLGGSSALNGLLLVKNDDSQGTVCSRFMSDSTASIVCKQLGYGGGAVQTGLHADLAATLPVLLNNLVCVGNEFSIEACAHSPWGVNVCGAEEAASISCTPPVLTRVVGGSALAGTGSSFLVLLF